MTNIAKILKIADNKSLVLMDELGAGTDPIEGAALAQSVLEIMLRKELLCAATTHYAELKAFALNTEGVSNASCEFDVETLRPTYKLIIGTPGKSNAFAISRRLGLPEEVIQAAKDQMDSESVRFEDVLTQLEDQRRQMELARQEAEHLRHETEKVKQQSEEYHEQLRKEKEKAMEAALRDYQEPVPGARDKLIRVLKIMLTVWCANQLKLQADKMMEEM